MSDESRNSRLPPPAFPPGTRKQVHRNSSSPKGPTPPEPGVDDAVFIFPDDPMPERRDVLEDAFISPDDPLPERSGADPMSGPLLSSEEALLGYIDADEMEEGVVTGMGFDAHLEPEELVTGGDPHVMELVEAVGKLAEALRRKGEAGLRALPGMSRFDATLRSYCVGYLAGRRAEDEAEDEDEGRVIE